MESLPYIVTLSSITFFIYFAVRLSYRKNNTYGNSKIFNYNLFGKYVLLYAYAALILFTVFRVIDVGYGGIDAMAYKQYFLGSSGTWFEALNFQNYEFGYATFIWLIRNMTEEYMVVLIFIYTAMFLMLIKYTKYMTWNKFTIISIFLLLALVVNSFNTTRVIIAVFIGMMVFILISKEKYVKSIILAIIATNIHISALILFPIIAINKIMNYRKKISFSKLIMYIILVMVLAIFSLNLADTFIGSGKYYAYENYKEGIAIQTYIIILIVFVLAVFKYKKMVEINAFNKTLIITLPIALIILPLQMNYSILYRMLIYFLPIVYTLIPALLKVYSVKNMDTIYYFPIKLGLLSYLLLKVYIFITVELSSAGLPYINILFNR